MKSSKKDSPQKPVVPAVHPLQQELLARVEKVRSEAKLGSARAKKIEGDMQSVVDEANAIIPLIPYIKPQEVESLIAIWNSTDSQIISINRDLLSADDSTGGTISANSTSNIRISGAYINGGLLTSEPDFSSVWHEYQIYTSRPSLKAEVIQLLKLYNFDKASVADEKSPLEHFEIAHQAYEHPVSENDPIGTSLIPLRECIQSVLDGLLKMRPFQEETKNEKSKILSIGKQLLIDNFPEDLVQEWADEWHDLNKGDLSLSKRKDRDRVIWLAQLNRGTSFLNALLRGLDDKKFRK